MMKQLQLLLSRLPLRAKYRGPKCFNSLRVRNSLQGASNCPRPRLHDYFLSKEGKKEKKKEEREMLEIHVRLRGN